MNKNSGLYIVTAVVAVIVIIVFGIIIAGKGGLSSRVEEDLEVFNSGSLDVPGISVVDSMNASDFVADIVRENTTVNNDDGKIISAVLPYIEFEVSDISDDTAEFVILSPDLGAWLKKLEIPDEYSSEMLYDDMVDYIPEAPKKHHYVTVEYTKGSSGWEGNYMTSEFADALSGGLFSAYGELYEQFLQELEGTAE